MTNKDLMYKFISKVYSDGLITKFLKIILNYQNLSDINYLFRVSVNDVAVIMDVFDNISDNRFNRYFFEFKKGKCPFVLNELDNIFITQIKVLSLSKNYQISNNLIRLAYLFKHRPSKMIKYAKTFLSDDLVNILHSVIDDLI